MMTNRLEVYSSFLAAKEAGIEFAKKRNLKFNMVSNTVVDEEKEDRYFFVFVKDKEDAMRYAGVHFASVAFHDDYQEVMPEDAYNFLISRVGKG